jgi:hypothetical protein
MIADDLARLRKGINQNGDSTPRKDRDAAMAASLEANTQEDAAKLLNVSRGSVQRARRVREFGVPELGAAVRAGLVSVRAAANVTRLSEEKQRRVVAGGPEAIREATARPEQAEPRRVFLASNGGVAKEISAGVVRVKQPIVEQTSHHPAKKVDDHERVRELTAQGLTVSDIAPRGAARTARNCRPEIRGVKTTPTHACRLHGPRVHTTCVASLDPKLWPKRARTSATSLTCHRVTHPSGPSTSTLRARVVALGRRLRRADDTAERRGAERAPSVPRCSAPTQRPSIRRTRP